MLAVSKLFLNGTGHGRMTISLLRERDWDVSDKVKPLHRAARLGNTKIITRLLAELQRDFTSPGVVAAIPGWAMVLGYTPLHLASLTDQADVVDALIKAGCITSATLNGNGNWNNASGGGGLTAWAVAEASGGTGAVACFEHHAAAGHIELANEKLSMAVTATATTTATGLPGRSSSIVSPSSRMVDDANSSSQLPYDRLCFWWVPSGAEFTNWQARKNDGGFSVTHIFPPLETDSKLIHQAALLPLDAKRRCSVVSFEKGLNQPLADQLVGLRHSNLAQVYGFVLGPTPLSSDPVWMVASEHLQADGCLSLAERLHESGTAALSEAEACAVVAGVTNGLAHLHSAGLAHLALRPEDIVLLPRVADDAGGSTIAAKITNHGLRGATAALPATSPAYLSPEGRWREERLPHVDIYALGGIIWEMVHKKPLASAFESAASPSTAHATPTPLLDYQGRF